MAEATDHSAPRDERASSSAPLVSVVVVSWNALAIVQQCLPSVVQSSYPNLEIIFADNASTDGSSEWVIDNHPEVKIVRHPENWAFCKGNNEAVKHATGKYVVLLNNDVEVSRDWLEPLVDLMEREQSVGAVQPKLLSHSDRTRFEYAGAAGGYLDKNGYPFARGRLFFTLEEDKGQYSDPIDIFWAAGAAIMIRTDLYANLGGLDERLFMHMEEIDFCWRLMRHGHRVVCNPASTVYHIGGASLAKGSPRKVYLNYRNNLLVLYKNMPQHAWTGLLVRRVFWDGVGMLRALVLLRPSESLSIFHGFISAHRMKKDFAASRPTDEEEDVFPSYQGNIVVDYFLKGRRRFSELSRDRFIR